MRYVKFSTEFQTCEKTGFADQDRSSGAAPSQGCRDSFQYFWSHRKTGLLAGSFVFDVLSVQRPFLRSCSHRQVDTQCRFGRLPSWQANHRLAGCRKRWLRYGNALIDIKRKAPTPVHLPRRKALLQPYHRRRPFQARRRTSLVGRRLPRARLLGSRPEPEPKLK